MAIRKKAESKPAMKPAMSNNRRSYKVSENVTVKAIKGTPVRSDQGSGLGDRDVKGAAQAVRQNVKAATPMSKAEAKANARGLKAANGPKKPSALSQKIAKKMYPAGVLKMEKKK